MQYTQGQKGTTGAMMPRKEEPLTTRQVAVFLGVHEETVRNYIRLGKLRGKWRLNNPKLGYRVTRAALAEFLRELGEEEMAIEVESSEAPPKGVESDDDPLRVKAS
jgi:hypothetical protein